MNQTENFSTGLSPHFIIKEGFNQETKVDQGTEESTEGNEANKSTFSVICSVTTGYLLVLSKSDDLLSSSGAERLLKDLISDPVLDTRLDSHSEKRNDA